MSRSKDGVWVFSALVGGPSVVSSIENPIICSLPEQFLAANILRLERRIRRHRTGNRSTHNVIDDSIFTPTSQFVHFCFFFTFTFISLVVIGARVRAQSHVSVSPMLGMYIRCLPTCRMGHSSFPPFSGSLTNLLAMIQVPSRQRTQQCSYYVRFSSFYGYWPIQPYRVPSNSILLFVDCFSYFSHAP
jgi:hypothetical protein